MQKNELISVEKIHIPRWSELPNVDLYLDQIVTFINSSLSDFTFLNNGSNDKKESQILTKTMINNYVKNKLIDAPEKKKYSKIQCAKIFVICILKQVYSMNDIANLINIALEDSDAQYAYDSFCNHFEQSLYCSYNKTDFSQIDLDNEKKYLLKSVLLSCSYKIYAQNYISTLK